jgi:hypothetical protein
MKATNSSMESYVKSLESTLEVYLVKKAPYTLPPQFKEFIVQYGPWILLVLLVLSVPIILALIGLSTLLLPFSSPKAGITASPLNLITTILTLVTLFFELISLPGLFKRQRQGWYLFFYSTLFSILENLVSFNILGLILGSLLSLYILFQVKEYYK